MEWLVFTRTKHLCITNQEYSIYRTLSTPKITTFFPGDLLIMLYISMGGDTMLIYNSITGKLLTVETQLGVTMEQPRYFSVLTSWV